MAYDEAANATAGLTFNASKLFWMASVAALWAWSFLSFYSEVNQLPFSADKMIEPVFRAIGFLAISLTFFCITLANGQKVHQATMERFLSAIIALLSPWMPISYLLVDEYSLAVTGLEIACWLMSGIALGSMMYLARPQRIAASLKTAAFEIGLAFTFAALIYLAASFLPKPTGMAMLIALPYLSLACHRLSRKKVPDAEGSLPATKPQPFPASHYLRGSLSTQPTQFFNQAIFSMALGIGICTSITVSNTFPSSIIFAFCIAGPAGITMASFLDRFTLEKMQWYLPVLAIAGLLPITLGLQNVTSACCVLLAFCCNAYGLVHTIQLTDLMKEQGDSADSIFSSGKTILYAGNAFGWTAACIAHRSTGFTSWHLSIVIIVLVLATILIICWHGRPWIGRQENFPCESPIAEMPQDNDVISAIAAEFKLTSRQAEVFDYLAHGRNAPYICDKLVLSYNTVKAHIYQIYRKLDVHTQQELIDMFEERMAREASTSVEHQKIGQRKGLCPASRHDNR